MVHAERYAFATPRWRRRPPGGRVANTSRRARTIRHTAARHAARARGQYRDAAVAVELSYCVVNTDGRELLLRCLDAIAAEQATLEFATEVLVLDNASVDGSAAA